MTGIFLSTNGGRVWVFKGISRGKVGGMEWQAEWLPTGGKYHITPMLYRMAEQLQGAGLWPAIQSLRLSLRKSLGKLIPSLHWLIRISHTVIFKHFHIVTLLYSVTIA